MRCRSMGTAAVPLPASPAPLARCLLPAVLSTLSWWPFTRRPYASRPLSPYPRRPSRRHPSRPARTYRPHTSHPPYFARAPTLSPPASHLSPALLTPLAAASTRPSGWQKQGVRLCAHDICLDLVNHLCTAAIHDVNVPFLSVPHHCHSMVGTPQVTNQFGLLCF